MAKTLGKNLYVPDRIWDAMMACATSLSEQHAIKTITKGEIASLGFVTFLTFERERQLELVRKVKTFEIDAVLEELRRESEVVAGRLVDDVENAEDERKAPKRKKRKK